MSNIGSHHVHIDPATIVNKAKDIAEHAVDDVLHIALTTDQPSNDKQFSTPASQNYWRDLPNLFGGADKMAAFGKNQPPVFDGELHITFQGAWDQVNEAMYSPVKEQDGKAYVFSQREVILLSGFLKASASQIGSNPSSANKDNFAAFATALRGCEATFPKQKAMIEDAISAVNDAFTTSAQGAQNQANKNSGRSQFDD